jgi:hypothetical protein
MGDHLGSTSKEVAAVAIESFYLNLTSGIEKPILIGPPRALILISFFFPYFGEGGGLGKSPRK